jgi:hypothetical protein
MGTISLTYFRTKRPLSTCEECGRSPVRIVVVAVRYRGWWGDSWHNEAYVAGYNGREHEYCSKACAENDFRTYDDVEIVFKEIRKKD